MPKPITLLLIIFMFTCLDIESVRILQSSEGAKASKNKDRLEISFEEYIVKYKKTYENEEEKAKRCKIFESNVQKVKESGCHACGITKFTDHAQEEIQQLRGIRVGQDQPNGLLAASQTISSSTLSSSASLQDSNTNDSTNATNSKAPKSFDWRDYGVVTSVKNQYKCGVCWAFSTCAFFESELIRRGQAKSSIDLSQQYLLQCDSSSDGCKGGNLYSPMDLVLSGGIPFQSSFPYNPQFSYPGICLINRGPIFPFSSRVTVRSLTDSELIQYLLQRPLNIPIKSTDWQNYSPTEEDMTFECKEIKNGTKDFNHAVLLVGFTETEWIVKNQWGEDWGIDGYIYITRNAKYNCGIGLQINTLDYRLKAVSFESVSGGSNGTSQAGNSQIVSGQEKSKK